MTGAINKAKGCSNTYEVMFELFWYETGLRHGQGIEEEYRAIGKLFWVITFAFFPFIFKGKVFIYSNSNILLYF